MADMTITLNLGDLVVASGAASAAPAPDPTVGTAGGMSTGGPGSLESGAPAPDASEGAVSTSGASSGAASGAGPAPDPALGADGGNADGGTVGSGRAGVGDGPPPVPLEELGGGG